MLQELPSRLISFVGLTLQVSATGLLAWMFLLLARSFGARTHVRIWACAWIAYSVALAAILVRYIIGGDLLALREWDEDGVVARSLYTLYAVGKVLFATLLVYGVWRFERGPVARSKCVAGLALPIVGAVVFAINAPHLLAIVIWCAPFLVTCFVISAVLLYRTPSHLASLGTLSTARALLLASVVTTFTALSFQPGPLAFLDVEPLRSFRFYYATLSTYFDLLSEFFLAVGMIVIVLQDVGREAVASRHEKEQLRLELARGEKLRALGTLVSGLAHELNNPLTAILGYAETARLEKLPKSTHQALDVILEQTERCRAIVSELLGMSGNRSETRKRVRVADLLVRVRRGLLPQAQNAHVEIQLEHADETAALHVDATAVEQAMTNLIGNAVDASADGARVLVRTRSAGGLVLITVLDQGLGITPEAFPRLFEPFFSTKPQGRGTGLGLALALGIIENHGGSITARNSTGGGACFEVRLPAALPERVEARPHVRDALAQDEVSAPVPRDAIESPRPRRALVVEDEASVRHLIREVLTRAGWTVYEASDGLEAEALLFGDAAPLVVDAVVTDLRMPRRGGLELVSTLAQRRPELVRRTLLIGGDLSTRPIRDLLEQMPCAAMEKPFAPAALLERLEALVHEAGTVS